MPKYRVSIDNVGNFEIEAPDDAALKSTIEKIRKSPPESTRDVAGKAAERLGQPTMYSGKPEGYQPETFGSEMPRGYAGTNAAEQALLSLTSQNPKGVQANLARMTGVLDAPLEPVREGIETRANEYLGRASDPFTRVLGGVVKEGAKGLATGENVAIAGALPFAAPEAIAALLAGFSTQAASQVPDQLSALLEATGGQGKEQALASLLASAGMAALPLVHARGKAEPGPVDSLLRGVADELGTKPAEAPETQGPTPAEAARAKRALHEQPPLDRLEQQEMIRNAFESSSMDETSATLAAIMDGRISPERADVWFERERRRNEAPRRTLDRGGRRVGDAVPEELPLTVDALLGAEPDPARTARLEELLVGKGGLAGALPKGKRVSESITASLEDVPESWLSKPKKGVPRETNGPEETARAVQAEVVQGVRDLDRESAAGDTGEPGLSGATSEPPAGRAGDSLAGRDAEIAVPENVKPSGEATGVDWGKYRSGQLEAEAHKRAPEAWKATTKKASDEATKELHFARTDGGNETIYKFKDGSSLRMATDKNGKNMTMAMAPSESPVHGRNAVDIIKENPMPKVRKMGPKDGWLASLPDEEMSRVQDIIENARDASRELDQSGRRPSGEEELSRVVIEKVILRIERGEDPRSAVSEAVKWTKKERPQSWAKYGASAKQAASAMVESVVRSAEPELTAPRSRAPMLGAERAAEPEPKPSARPPMEEPLTIDVTPVRRQTQSDIAETATDMGLVLPEKMVRGWDEASRNAENVDFLKSIGEKVEPQVGDVRFTAGNKELNAIHDDLPALADAAASGDQAAVAKRDAALERANQLVQELFNVSADAGRTLNIHKMTAQSFDAATMSRRYASMFPENKLPAEVQTAIAKRTKEYAVKERNVGEALRKRADAALDNLGKSGRKVSAKEILGCR